MALSRSFTSRRTPVATWRGKQPAQEQGEQMGQGEQLEIYARKSRRVPAWLRGWAAPAGLRGSPMTLPRHLLQPQPCCPAARRVQVPPTFVSSTVHSAYAANVATTSRDTRGWKARARMTHTAVRSKGPRGGVCVSKCRAHGLGPAN